MFPLNVNHWSSEYRGSSFCHFARQINRMRMRISVDLHVHKIEGRSSINSEGSAVSSSGMSQDTTTSVASIAGAIVEAVREGLTQQQQRSNREMPIPARDGVGTSASLYHRASTIGSSRRDALSHGPMWVNAEEPGSRKRFAAPSMFLSKRMRRNETQPKRIAYVRDIFCLPLECQGRSGTVVIPRGERRNALANEEVGLMGKIEFYSDWSADRMRREVCSVFAKAFGLTPESIAEGNLFPFDYLQRTGAGSRLLCVPAVTESFEWNGRQVSTLAKSGSVIYILARKEILSLSRI